jgi:preprotein translocase subunit YajC
VTIGGMHGKVFQVDSDTLVLELDRGMKVKVEKSAISLDFSKKPAQTK